MVNQKRNWRKILLIVTGVVGVVVVLIAVAALQVRAVYTEVLNMQPTVSKAQGNLEAQDLPALRQTLGELSGQIQNVRGKLGRLAWTRWIPVVGSYYRDGGHGLEASSAGIDASIILVDAIEPYADVLGFQGSGSFSGGTAEDRIIVMLETLDKVTPQLDAVAAKLSVVDEHLGQINEQRYPFEFNGMNISEELKQLKEVVHGATAAVTDAKPALEALPTIAGMEGEKKYMVLFHNDGELRGTGGFMTAYAILRVDKGRVNAERSSDIYDLDNKFRERLRPPEMIRKNLNVPYWHLRDMNLSVDFKNNMDLFTGYYEKIPGEPKIDGVIGVDTNVLVDLLKILGPIDVPGYGRFSTDNEPRCNCPQVVYQLELIADRPVATLVDNRKGVLGPLMREIIVKAYAAPKAWWDDLFKVIVDNTSNKHLVFYFADEELQQAAESLGAAGRVSETEGDYLLVADVNLGGAKSNFFVTQDVTSQLDIAADGTVKRTLTVTYINSAPASNCNLETGQLCLNARMPNYTRIFVPKGSQLIESVGLDEEVAVTEENGKTVFEGFVNVHPQSSTKTIYTYTLPWRATEAPSGLVVQKQVGKDVSRYKMELPDRVEEFELSSDKSFDFDW